MNSVSFNKSIFLAFAISAMPVCAASAAAIHVGASKYRAEEFPDSGKGAPISESKHESPSIGTLMEFSKFVPKSAPNKIEVELAKTMAELTHDEAGGMAISIMQEMPFWEYAGFMEYLLRLNKSTNQEEHCNRVASIWCDFKTHYTPPWATAEMAEDIEMDRGHTKVPSFHAPDPIKVTPVISYLRGLEPAKRLQSLEILIAPCLKNQMGLVSSSYGLLGIRSFNLLVPNTEVRDQLMLGLGYKIIDRKFDPMPEEVRDPTRYLAEGLEEPAIGFNIQSDLLHWCPGEE